MSAVPCPLDASPGSSDARAVAYAAVYVTLTKQEHLELLTRANSYRSLHRRAVDRARWREERYQRLLRQIRDHAERREVALRAELEVAHAKLRALQQRMFGRKSERRKGGSQQAVQALVSRAPRGHQRGTPGHGRTTQSHLPARGEFAPRARPAHWRSGSSPAPVRHSSVRGARRSCRSSGSRTCRRGRAADDGRPPRAPCSAHPHQAGNRTGASRPPSGTRRRCPRSLAGSAAPPPAA